MQDREPLGNQLPSPPSPPTRSSRSPRPPRPPKASTRPRRNTSPRPAVGQAGPATPASGDKACEDALDGLSRLSLVHPTSSAGLSESHTTACEHPLGASLLLHDVDAFAHGVSSAAQEQAHAPPALEGKATIPRAPGRHDVYEHGQGLQIEEDEGLAVEPRYRRAWQSSGPTTIPMPGRPGAPELHSHDSSYSGGLSLASSYSPPARLVSIFNLAEVSESPVEAAYSPPTTPAGHASLVSPPLGASSPPRMASSLPASLPSSAFSSRASGLSGSTFARMPSSPEGEVVSRPPTAPATLELPRMGRRSSGGLSSTKSARRLSAILTSGFGFGRSRTESSTDALASRQKVPRRPRTSDGLMMHPPPGLSATFADPDQPPSPQPLRSSSPSPTRQLPSLKNPVSLARSSTIGLTWRSTLSPETFQRLALEYGTVEMKRQEVIYELCETERAFVAGLRDIIGLLAAPLRTPDGAWLDMVPPPVSRLFRFLDDIASQHAEVSAALDDACAAQAPVVLCIADAFEPFVDRLAVHQPYLVRLETVSALIDDLVAGRVPHPSSSSSSSRGAMQHLDAQERERERGRDLGRFAEFLWMQSRRPECGGLSLASHLLKPVQRLMKYPLFLRQLCELSPPSHPDHTATHALHHSTGAMILALQEVKAREDAHAALKLLSARMRGLPDGFRLASRARRLEAQGPLRLVHLSERDRTALCDLSHAPPPPPPSRRPVPPGSSSRPISTVSVDSGSSLGSTASSGSPMSSGSLVSGGSDTTSSSTGPSTPGSLLGSSSSPSWSRTTSARAAEAQPAPQRLRIRARESSVQAWVLSDVLILAQGDAPKTLRSVKALEREKAREGAEAIRLLDGLGVSRIVGVRDWSGTTDHEFLVQVDVMPVVGKGQPVSPSSASPTSLFLTLPASAPTGSPQPGSMAALASVGKQQKALSQTWLRALASAREHSEASPRGRGHARSSSSSTMASIAGITMGRGANEESAWWTRRLAAVRREMDGAATAKEAAPARPARIPPRDTAGLGIESIVYQRRTSS